MRQHFNPPTRKGWDLCHVQYNKETVKNFNPPTRKGWDGDTVTINTNKGQFQSTHPQGVGRKRLVIEYRQLLISIHPPARGGTSCPGGGSGDRRDFNPPTRKGWDVHFGAVIGVRIGFQSTHPQGVGRTLPTSSCSTDLFQSTHPQGVGRFMMLPHFPSQIFQSTHPQGVGL